jgi:hypothetical protein
MTQVLLMYQITMMDCVVVCVRVRAKIAQLDKTRWSLPNSVFDKYNDFD